MGSIHSIIIIKKDDKFLNYYDDRWDMYLFPNIKRNNIDEIKEKYNTDNVRFLFDKEHDKYYVSHGENRTYHHYFYEVKSELYSKKNNVNKHLAFVPEENNKNTNNC